MTLRKFLLAGFCGVSLVGTAAPLVANAQVSVYFNSAPPPARYEAMPAARRGYVWIPGYWDGRGRRHVWTAGHWERARNGYNYVQPNWIERDNRWELNRGGWQRNPGGRDRDGDGVRNNRDRAPNNPYRQ
jgi:WXXGXW repeat (2 copies)